MRTARRTAIATKDDCRMGGGRSGTDLSARREKMANRCSHPRYASRMRLERMGQSIPELTIQPAADAGSPGQVAYETDGLRVSGATALYGQTVTGGVCDVERGYGTPDAETGCLHWGSARSRAVERVPIGRLSKTARLAIFSGISRTAYASPRHRRRNWQTLTDLIPCADYRTPVRSKEGTCRSRHGRAGVGSGDTRAAPPRLSVGTTLRRDVNRKTFTITDVRSVGRTRVEKKNAEPSAPAYWATPTLDASAR